MEPIGIDGAWIFTPEIHRDGRGSFLEWFRGDELAGHLGYRPGIAQGNCSLSRQGVVRGIHFADVPPGQAKYVTCVNGAVLDVVVDLRVGSPTFARWEAVRLDDGTRSALYLSEGLGHAFMALSEQATVLYLCITWPGQAEVILSEKDAAAPGLTEAIGLGLLPDYRECLSYAAGLAGR
jgi:dTDP-4-dehydrorhamnose 3,5-epimerase